MNNNNWFEFSEQLIRSICERLINFNFIDQDKRPIPINWNAFGCVNSQFQQKCSLFSHFMDKNALELEHWIYTMFFLSWFTHPFSSNCFFFIFRVTRTIVVSIWVVYVRFCAHLVLFLSHFDLFSSEEYILSIADVCPGSLCRYFYMFVHAMCIFSIQHSTHTRSLVVYYNIGVFDIAIAD